MAFSAFPQAAIRNANATQLVKETTMATREGSSSALLAVHATRSIRLQARGWFTFLIIFLLSLCCSVRSRAQGQPPPNTPVPLSFVGMSFANPADNPNLGGTPIAYVDRLWDDGLVWPFFETANGTWNSSAFTDLDNVLNQDYTNGFQYAWMTLNRTPNWALQTFGSCAANPNQPACDYNCDYAVSGGSGTTAPGQCYAPTLHTGSPAQPDLAVDGSGQDSLWKAWVTEIASHVNATDYLHSNGCNGTTFPCHIPVHYWEIWNEVDSTGDDAENNTGGGWGYTATPTVKFTGGGYTTIATATATRDSSNNIISSVTVNSGGAGYTSQPTISFTNGGGSGASAVATLTPTSVASVSITKGGTYTSTPTVTFVGGGCLSTCATATALMSHGTSGSVTGVSFGSHGSGYTYAPQVQFSSTSCTTSCAIGTATLTGTSVASVTLTGGYINPTGASGLGGVSLIGSYAQLVRMTEDAACIIKGSSYISTIHNDPKVGNTTACTATAIDPNAVIVMPSFHSQKLFGVNAAQNYLYCGGQSWTNNNAYTASANAILGTGGSVSSITMTAYGAGYTSIPQVQFSPAPGTGTTATGFVPSLTGGKVESITISNAGSNYTSAPTVTIEGGSAVTGSPEYCNTGSDAANAIEAINFHMKLGDASSDGLDGFADLEAELANEYCAVIGQNNSVTNANNVQECRGFNSYPGILKANELVKPFYNGEAGYSDNTGGGALGTPTISGGAVTQITVPPGGGGSGYTSQPTVLILSTVGTGASYTANLGSGSTAEQVVSYTKVSGGSGYSSTNPPYVFVYGGGAGAWAGNGQSLDISDNLDYQTSFVGRYALMMWSLGITNFDWYQWDGGSVLNPGGTAVGLTSPGLMFDETPTLDMATHNAGNNYMTTPCGYLNPTNYPTTWICTFTNSSGFINASWLWDTDYKTYPCPAASNDFGASCTTHYVTVPPNYTYYCTHADSSCTTIPTQGVPVGVIPVEIYP
jgi:hypothetical protein